MAVTAVGDGKAVGEGSRPSPGAGGVERRILDAALRCLARWGVAKTSLDDLAREAGVSRATVYRAFPGGKETVLDAVVADELGRFASALAARLEGSEDLESLLVAGITFTSRTLIGHQALQYLVTHEPEQVLPHVSFGRFDALLAAASHLVAPHLARFVGDEVALRTGEWVTRLVVSYTMAPSESYDFTDELDVSRFVRSYVLPGLDEHGTAATTPRLLARHV